MLGFIFLSASAVKVIFESKCFLGENNCINLYNGCCRERLGSLSKKKQHLVTVFS